MKSSRKKYSAEFKIWAVKTCIEHKSVRLAAAKLRINKNSLQHWKNLFREGKLTLQERSGPGSGQKGNSQTAEGTQKYHTGAGHLERRRRNPAPGQALRIPVHMEKYGQISRREDVRSFSGDSQLLLQMAKKAFHRQGCP